MDRELSVEAARQAGSYAACLQDLERKVTEMFQHNIDATLDLQRSLEAFKEEIRQQLTEMKTEIRQLREYFGLGVAEDDNQPRLIDGLSDHLRAEVSGRNSSLNGIAFASPDSGSIDNGDLAGSSMDSYEARQLAQPRLPPSQPTAPYGRNSMVEETATVSQIGVVSEFDPLAHLPAPDAADLERELQQMTIPSAPSNELNGVRAYEQGQEHNLISFDEIVTADSNSNASPPNFTLPSVQEIVPEVLPVQDEVEPELPLLNIEIDSDLQTLRAVRELVNFPEFFALLETDEQKIMQLEIMCDRYGIQT